ncbi:MAG TPA: glycosyltransferase family 2 protein [Afifellaceae bacterium]|nr:glycosyltransferase family 2 protein [Afifellaceae bacterium]
MRPLDIGSRRVPQPGLPEDEVWRRLRQAFARRRIALAGGDAALPPDIAPLLRQGFPPGLLNTAAELARYRGTTARDELFALPQFERGAYWRGIAEDLGVGFVEGAEGLAVDPGLGYVPSAALRRASRVMVTDGSRSLLLLAPEVGEIERLRRYSRAHPEFAARLRIAPPEVIRALLLARFRRRYVYGAVSRLARAMPQLSAGSGSSSAILRQTLFVVTALTVILVSATGQGWLGVGIAVSLTFLNSVCWKLAAALTTAPPPRRERLGLRQLPTYTILVPLYREANMVAELVAAMSAIDYPRAKLQILLIAEADDEETLGALRRHATMPPFEIVTVPKMQPRTKPKALAFPVPFARGEMVVVYDAEDRPEPEQLRHAAAAFAADPTLGCVQARLTPDNSESWLARMFTIEYAANFEVLLPSLAGWGVPLPLGGTSNHFPRAILQRVGAWDPFNVTEDADLGIRLARFGYRSAALASRTYEEAPVRWRDWLRQRRRWIKGWAQTALVALRFPRPRLRPLDALVVHGLITGAVLSLLAYPVSLVLLPVALWSIESGAWPQSPLGWSLLAVNGVNLAGFLLASGIAAWRGLRAVGRLDLAPWIVTLPAYWLLMSIAAWQALFWLLRDPFEWEKTPHGISRQRRPTLRGRPA